MAAPEGTGATTPSAPALTAATAAAYEFFLELGDYAFRHHPPDIWINASTLARKGVVGPASSVKPRTLRRRVAHAGGPTWAYLRETVRHRVRRRRHDPHPPDGPDQVLAAWPFGRRDYVGLIAPVLTRLAKGGVRCGVLTIPTGLDSWRDAAADHRIPVRALPAALEPGVHREARRLFASLRPSVDDLAARFRLDRGTRAALHGYFVAYTFDKVLAGRHLERLTPDVVLGIHFVTRRGWQGALHDAAARGRKSTVLLMQHGAFSADEAFHDFEGADVALVWGERWRRELGGFATLPFAPLPGVAVSGNPKYDTSTPWLAPPAHAGTPRVLYVSNHGGGHETLVEPLRLTIDASRQGDGFDLVVRLHPVEKRGAVIDLVDRGLLASRQLAPASEPLADAILGADVVVGPPSTTLFEAARLGRPVVVIADRPARIFDGFRATSDVAQLWTWVRNCVAVDAVAAQAPIVADLFGSPGGACNRTVALVRRHL